MLSAVGLAGLVQRPVCRPTLAQHSTHMSVINLSLSRRKVANIRHPPSTVQPMFVKVVILSVLQGLYVCQCNRILIWVQIQCNFLLQSRWIRVSSNYTI